MGDGAALDVEAVDVAAVLVGFAVDDFAADVGAGFAVGVAAGDAHAVSAEAIAPIPSIPINWRRLIPEVFIVYSPFITAVRTVGACDRLCPIVLVSGIIGKGLAAKGGQRWPSRCYIVYAQRMGIELRRGRSLNVSCRYPSLGGVK